MPRVTVGPKTGGGWQVSGDTQTYKTQRAREQAARKQAGEHRRWRARRQGARRTDKASEHDRTTRSAAVEGVSRMLPVQRKGPPGDRRSFLDINPTDEALAGQGAVTVNAVRMPTL